MNFADAIKEQPARTENGMLARKGTADASTDLFFKIGASRGKNILPEFVAAFVENEDYALRILQWARDVRGGAGERSVFNQILEYLANNNKDLALRILHKVPVLGYWKDVLPLLETPIQAEVVQFIAEALAKGDGLCAKWMPRESATNKDMRRYARILIEKIGISPKQYRKGLVQLTNVVETKMCNREWNDINFNHVPSIAAARYRKAFTKNSTTYADYVAALAKGEAKINANAIFPYDVIKNITGTNLEVVIAQWDALPNYLGDQKVLAMVDVSGSMMCPAGTNKNLTCLDVAVSLGLYTADKLSGAFKDCVLLYSSEPSLLQLKGNIVQKLQQLKEYVWYQSTNLHAAFDSVLQTGLQNNVADEDMPDTILILSDMQFDQCVRHDDTAMQMIERKYAEAGYTVPKVVFWNLNARDNVPVRFNKKGTGLVSGFSPAILKSILATSNFSPQGIMEEAILVERYNY